MRDQDIMLLLSEKYNMTQSMKYIPGALGSSGGVLYI